MRGEDVRKAEEDNRDVGLPPRARGRLRGLPAPVVGIGTTPACAGKTATAAWAGSRKRDYPRVRGEDGSIPRHSSTQSGLPPRARGRLGLGIDPMDAGGTTPACAGKTVTPTALTKGVRDYPRVRGEDPPSSFFFCQFGGLPPRARGRPAVAADFHAVRGTTPACAGKTSSARTAHRRRRDYPRVRGEDRPLQPTSTRSEGLPPRARGRQGVGRHRKPGRGTTPACAGKTPILPPPGPCAWDYPRVRGEDASALAAGRSRRGLPPRARGRRARGR